MNYLKKRIANDKQ